MRVKTAYIEPEDYCPRKLRKKYKLGEYATEKKKRKTEKKKKRKTNRFLRWNPDDTTSSHL